LWDIPICDSSTGCFISAAPLVFDHKIFIGEAGADFGAADHVHAFDADTLKLLWTFRTTPLSGEGASTWSKDSDRRGAAVWSTLSLDADKSRLYVSLGNAGPDFDGRDRPGANLFSDCVVVLDAKTGKLLWYVQQIAHDTHDWDTGAAPVIYDQDGRELLAVGSKDGHVYIYDRATHRELARQEVSLQLNADKELSSTAATRFCPGTLGGVEWNGPALDPVSKLLFVNSVDWCATVTLLKEPSPAIPWGAVATQDPVKEARGTLRAIDALSGKEKWRFDADAPMLAGVTTTATGLVLTGTGDGLFLVFDGRSGRELYRFATGAAIAGGISTYEVGSRQYVAVLSGNASKSVWQNTGAATVIVFALPDD
jgi:glucose dehydrogenase